MKEVVLDTETTGISTKEGHRIVEIGCIELENLVPTQNKFHCYLNPERKVSEKALEVHGYTDEFLANQKKFKDICDEFLESHLRTIIPLFGVGTIISFIVSHLFDCYCLFHRDDIHDDRWLHICGEDGLGSGRSHGPSSNRPF